MRLIYSLTVVAALVACGSLIPRVSGGTFVLGVIVPYAALAIFLVGVSYRVVKWAATPVPFRIPTTCGQQRSLPWIRSARLDNPSTGIGVLGRVALEVLLFRSLFRNNRPELYRDKYVTGDSKYLWLGALVFHWALLVILLRHLRLLVDPVPTWVTGINSVDGFFQVGMPPLYLTDILLLVALAYLLLRRLKDPWLRYISQVTDYFALVLLLGVAFSGFAMRYAVGADVVSIKQFALGLSTFQPLLPTGLGAGFWVHLILVCALAIYFPFSKLMHLGAIFLSPTRNLANNSRMKRHINPWNQPVKTHSYAEWEEEFRDKIVKAGIPTDEDQHV